MCHGWHIVVRTHHGSERDDPAGAGERKDNVVTDVASECPVASECYAEVCPGDDTVGEVCTTPNSKVRP